MREKAICLMAVLMLVCCLIPSALCESNMETFIRNDPIDFVYYNSFGGKCYHAVPACPAVLPQYWPLLPIPFEEINSEGYRNLLPCPKCNAPDRPASDVSANDLLKTDAGESDLRTLEYIEDDEGLTFLRIIMKDDVFARNSFPAHCYLDTFYDGSGVDIDWWPNLPDGPGEDWAQVLEENHPITLIFHFQEGKWALRNATDWRTWDLDVKNGTGVFCEYDDPYNAEWQWSATLDDDLMTFDFLKLETLIDQYNAAMPDRPSVAGDEE